MKIKLKMKDFTCKVLSDSSKKRLLIPREDGEPCFLYDDNSATNKKEKGSFY